MLFRPFRLGTWLKMGLIGLLGGGVATFSSNFNFRAPVFPPHGNMPNDPVAEIQNAIRSVHLADYFHLIVIVIAVLAAVALVFLYLFCRFRFVLFDSVISGQAEVGRGWSRYAGQANRYFGFWLLYRLVAFAVMVLIVGLPLWHAYQRGAFSGDNSLMNLFETLASVALGAFAAAIILAIISTLTKDFIMPIMALDDLALGDAWSALWRVIASEPGAWFGYMCLKAVCALGAGIALAIGGLIAMIPAFFIIGIPVGLLVFVGITVTKLAGVGGIFFFALAALVAIAGIFCMYLLLIAPVTVFFASYAFYFFGGRYPKLGALLWPQPVNPSPVPQMVGIQPGV